jgi:hypothetical protein
VTATGVDLFRWPEWISLRAPLKGSLPDFDPDDWIQTHVASARKGRHCWPDDEQKKMPVLLRVVEHMLGGQINPVSLGQLMTTAGISMGA